MFNSQLAAITGISATGDTNIVTIAVEDKSYLGFQFDVATQALDAFKVFVRFHPAGLQHEITPGAWATMPTARFKESSGNLAAQAAATSGYFGMDVKGLYDVQIRVSAAVNGASVTPRWGLS